jgi:hypothetical protein
MTEAKEKHLGNYKNPLKKRENHAQLIFKR